MTRRTRSSPLLRLTEPTLPPLWRLAPGLVGIWRRRWLSNDGPHAEAFGRELASAVGVPDTALVANATLGLTVALLALGADGEVIVPAAGFAATAQAVRLAGCAPVFADVDPDTWCLTAATAAPHIGPRTAAIIPVHLFGAPCDAPALEALAAASGLALLFDAAQAFGGRYPDGRPVGAAGTAEVFSFHATKVLPAGEGGAVASRDRAVVARCRRIARFGMDGDGLAIGPGLNAKLAEWPALLARRGLPDVPRRAARRARLVARYRTALAGSRWIVQQRLPAGAVVSHGFYPIRLAADAPLDADALAAHLRRRGIEARRYFHPALHGHPAFRDRAGVPLPVAEALAASSLCLPLSSHMSLATVDRVVAAVAGAIAEATSCRAS